MENQHVDDSSYQLKANYVMSDETFECNVTFPDLLHIQ